MSRKLASPAVCWGLISVAPGVFNISTQNSYLSSITHFILGQYFLNLFIQTFSEIFCNIYVDIFKNVRYYSKVAFSKHAIWPSAGRCFYRCNVLSPVSKPMCACTPRVVNPGRGKVVHWAIHGFLHAWSTFPAQGHPGRVHGKSAKEYPYEMG